MEALPRPPLAPPQPPLEIAEAARDRCARNRVRVGIDGDGSPTRVTVAQRLGPGARRLHVLHPRSGDHRDGGARERVAARLSAEPDPLAGVFAAPAGAGRERPAPAAGQRPGASDPPPHRGRPSVPGRSSSRSRSRTRPLRARACSPPTRSRQTSWRRAIPFAPHRSCERGGRSASAARRGRLRSMRGLRSPFAERLCSGRCRPADLRRRLGWPLGRPGHPATRVAVRRGAVDPPRRPAVHRRGAPACLDAKLRRPAARLPPLRPSPPVPELPGEPGFDWAERDHVCTRPLRPSPLHDLRTEPSDDAALPAAIVLGGLALLAFGLVVVWAHSSAAGPAMPAPLGASCG